MEMEIAKFKKILFTHYTKKLRKGYSQPNASPWEALTLCFSNFIYRVSYSDFS